MTATVAPQPELAAPVQYDPLRLLPIAANLLPQEVTEARRGKKLRIAIGGVVAGAVVLTACWYVYARSNTGSAQDGLTNAQQQMTSLQHEQTKYAPLVKAQSASKTIEGQLRQVMASDVQWWQLMPQLRAAAPAGVTLQTVTASMSIGVGASAGSGGPIASVPGVTSKDAVGAVTIVGTAPD
ncbi:MAG: hypothetical protein JO147_00425, partial [Actinobacteria bacterium]|nr:hypothetical protein [Actinomycetota bacterium]